MTKDKNFAALNALGGARQMLVREGFRKAEKVVAAFAEEVLKDSWNGDANRALSQASERLEREYHPDAAELVYSLIETTRPST